MPTSASSSSNRIGLVVFSSIASGLALGLVLVLVVFAGGPESEITGSALIALGAGFAVLAAASRRTTEPQAWAGTPGVVTIAAGLAILALSPGDHTLRMAGWIWPILVVGLVTRSFVQARRSLRHWSRRAFLYPSLVVLLLLAIGGAFETAADATATSGHAMGRTYLVDGHRLYLSCVGDGAATVVLFNGLGERTDGWAAVEGSVAASTRVCVFDRAGEGWSGPGPGAQDGHQLSLDAHELLRAGRVPGPYVVAGHSVGGVYALIYAAMYPREVAGVALIDSASPDQFELPDYPRFYSMWRRVGALLPTAARAGGRLFGASSSREYAADRVEFNELPRVFRQAKAIHSLRGKPLAVVTADRGAMRGWQAAQARLAHLSTNTVHIDVPGATHSSLLENARYARIVADAIVGVTGRAGTSPASQR
jgi:pimeloyl-ACP methyl ester carboxylesterase